MASLLSQHPSLIATNPQGENMTVYSFRHRKGGLKNEKHKVNTSVWRKDGTILYNLSQNLIICEYHSFKLIDTVFSYGSFLVFSIKKQYIIQSIGLPIHVTFFSRNLEHFFLKKYGQKICQLHWRKLFSEALTEAPAGAPPSSTQTTWFTFPCETSSKLIGVRIWDQFDSLIGSNMACLA